MNLTSCFCRNTRAVDLFFKHPLVFKVNYVLLTKINPDVRVKNITLKRYSISPESNDLVKRPLVLPKKRLIKKKKQLSYDAEEGFRIMAFSTAEEYNLENLLLALPKFTLYKPSTFGSEFQSRLANSVDVVHAKKNSETELVHQDLFFFRDGCVVMWNVPDSEINKILDLLRQYEENRYMADVIQNESEVLRYLISDSVDKTGVFNDCLILSASDDTLLEKYAISNAMALSVHLGTYEANLEQYIETMEPVTEDLKIGNKIKMSRNQVLQKTGQLFALRHNINLNSDLLDTPDFYWDREELETLYQIIINYYCIGKRTKVMNEKINHCIELVELLSSHLSDKHHVRLEWMIIVLIMVEVAFEFAHYFEKYIESHEK